jgi:hypothetical protein
MNANNRSYNDFNRKDLFTQHHRRMHTPWTPANKPPSKKANEEFEEGLEEVRLRCWRETRKAPTSSQCIFCPKRFEGATAWDDRMEHVGKHFERNEKEREGRDGGEDVELREWALREGIVLDCGNRGFWLDGYHRKRDMSKAAPTPRARGGRAVEVDADGDDE